jgi:peptidyl-prolyl cis-trans isomerase SurA
MRSTFLFAGLVSVLLSVSAFAEVRLVEEIVCKVNGDIVTKTELERDRARLTEELRRQGLSGARLNEGVASKNGDLLRDRIDNLLLISKGKELNTNVDSEVNKQLADIQRRAVTQDKGLADPEKFQQFVREQTGQSYEDYKGDLRNQLITQRVIREEVSSKIKFKREDLQAYYDGHQKDYQRDERIFLRELLVASNPDNVGAAEKKAKDLVARAKKGEKFPELVQANSDAATAQIGGFLDPATKGQLRPDLEKLVWDQPKGYVTDPISLPGGFLILKVEDHQKAGLASLEEVENDVTERLFEPKMQPMLREYLTKLRQEAFLEIKEGYVDSGAAQGKDTHWNDPAQLKPETTTKEEVLAKGRRKKLLRIVPVPGTHSDKVGTSSSH